ncbi:hypothetical protein CDD83_2513 [Cordyceps sp. RAO-2017]|nr:hypothetical protein CDD83_2513 [Cordyceps sp. RAO-2017]
MKSPQDFKALQEGIQKSLVSTVKVVNRLGAEDLSFQRTANPDTAEQLDDQASRVLRLSTRLLQSAARACNAKPPKLEDVEDIDMKWQAVVDVVDSVLEKADTALDEFTGLIKRREPQGAESQASSSKPTKSTGKVIRNANITKPQVHFERKPDNFPKSPWKPFITKKPHATVALEQSLVTFTGETGALQYKHPYEAEITSIEYPKRLFKVAEPIPPQPGESTSAIWVDSYQGVLDMLKDLKRAKEIAVDLEHHDFRTYNGLVCLMQVSTREKDWIVDTLQPWRHKLEVLNEAFADPSIVKVFHGAYMDMVWLQRDLGLYVNGLFDSYFACRALSYPGKSLAFLLSKFVNFNADKQYQLADWRIRPIPPDMMHYARSDTHYLLYIYDCLRNELVSASDRSSPDTDLIGRVLQESKELSLSRNEHPDYDEESGQGSRGWYNLILKKADAIASSEQFAVFRALWKWRDRTAREVDESPNFVLGTTNVLEIARINPPDVKALHSLVPFSAPLAKARLQEVWDLIRRAKARGGPNILHFLAPGSFVSASKPSASVMLPQASAPWSPPQGDVVFKSLSQSRLFGDMPISTRWEAAEQTPGGQDDALPFPWQRFVRDSATGGDPGDEVGGEADQEQTLVADAKAKLETSETGVDPMEEDKDEEFTLKRGRKRKSEAVEDEDDEDSEDEEQTSGVNEEAPEESSELIAVEDDGPKASKKQRKKERKHQEREEREAAKRREERMARKAKKRQEREKGRVEEGEEEAEAPFDYSKAPSVLHGKREAGGAGREVKKVFDPYAKTADDGLKGARRAPPIRGERSATFKK